MKKILTIIAISMLAAASSYAQKHETVIFKKGDNGYHTFRIPALIQTKSGDILAFAEGRKNSGGDSGDIDMVMKRSTDGGKTWGEMSIVWDDKENVCGNPSPVIDRKTGRVILVMTWNNGKDPEKKIHAKTSIDTRRVYVTYSDDEGKTWAEPREITSEAKRPEWQWYATGPCHSIQIRKGPHKGRIVVPCDHSNYGEGNFSHVIYSDDCGKSWAIGGIVKYGNESTITELSNGDLMLNMRCGDPATVRGEDKPYRLVAISHDGGESFDEMYLDKGLEEPVCNASIINYAPKGKLSKKILFSNPKHPSKRLDMSISMSKNNGKTWEKAIQLSDQPTAYSDMLILPNGDVMIFYERGAKRPYDEMVIAVISKDIFK